MSNIASILDSEIAIGSTVTIQGWVRTRRDSKAGLSFVHVHDGSCFDPLQVVAPNLCNYQDEILHLSSTPIMFSRNRPKSRIWCGRKSVNRRTATW